MLIKTRTGTCSPTVYAYIEHTISMHMPDSVLLLQALNLQCESIISLLRLYSAGKMSHHLSTKFYDSNLGGWHRRSTHYHVQNGIIVHYDTQEHTSQELFAAGVCCRIEPIYEPICLQTNSKYGGAVIWIIYTEGAEGWGIFNMMNKPERYNLCYLQRS